MSRSLADCIAEAVRGGHLTQQEGEDMLKNWRAIKALGHDDSKAKDLLVKDLAAEAAERERRALLQAGATRRLQDEVSEWTNRKGESDLPQAWQMLHDRRGDEGFFKPSDDGRTGLSAKELNEAIESKIFEDIEAVAHEFRRGAITGDLKRTSKALAAILPGAAKTQARMSEVVKALRGEKTTDAYAQVLADALMKTAEMLRLRFNEAGGSVGKLEGWGGPQFHNQEAVLRAGREMWITYILPLLDRDRMVHPLTGRKLSDAELRESLEVSWERITTDGWVDEEKVSGVPVGRGALWSQHADHRFLHFKSADAWMGYARQFGNPDPISSFFGWFAMMARDIAHMEKFGPNPNSNREYMKQWVVAKAKNVKPTATIIAEQAGQLKELQQQLTKPNPEYVALSDELADVHRQMDAMRNSKEGLIYRASGGEPGPRAQAYRAQYDALAQRGLAIEQQITQYRYGLEPMSIADTVTAQKITELLDDMRDRVTVANTDNPVGYALNVMRMTDAIWEFQRGSLNTPVNSRTANVMGLGRNIVTATALHSAVLSAITDVSFQSIRRGFVGMAKAQSNPVTALIETLKAIGPDNRREAVRAGLVLDSALHTWKREAEYATKLAKARATAGFVADRVIALQGLNAWTQGGKHAFGMSLQAMFADEAQTPWRALPELVRETLQRGGFDSGSWDQIRGATLYEPKPGAPFLRPNEIRDVSPDLSARYIAMILRETHYAIIEPTPTAKALMLGGTKPGTVAGELVRGAGQLKTFPITVMMMHMGHIASEIGAGRGARGAGYAGAMLITGTIFGALAMALKDINAGRDPRRWLDEETYLDPNVWGAALLQSGGLGIYGDFLFSQVNRQGGGWAKTLAGPMVERAESAWNLTGGNALDLANNAFRTARGEPTKPTRFGRELAKFTRQNTPSVVWANLVMQRMLHDQFQKLVDPEAQQAFQRQILQRRKDYRQEFFWEPGQTSPSRAPDLSRTFATRN